MSAALIKRFGRKINVEQYTTGAYVDGFWVPGASETIEITASVQPLTAEELLRLDDNQRTRESVKIYTMTKLKTTDQDSKINADVLIIDGKRYEVTNVTNWVIPKSGGLSYYKCEAISENRRTGE